MTAAAQLFDPADAIGFYVGRPGCACGCRGTHYYTDPALAEERGGTFDASKVANGAKRMLRDPRAVRDGDIVYVNGPSQRVVYLRDGAA